MAELARDDAAVLNALLDTKTARVCVLDDPATLTQQGAPPQPLDTGHGRLLVDEVAEQLDAVVM